ncbi:MAG: MBL fold metallo-hydrolase [Spirochaetales bacterium]|nr:MBL fold metallo-hydrolase [Spirochaetales bacterium]
MNIKFWGVRGSIPTPLTQELIKNKISAVINRVRPEDLESPLTRESFLSKLPPELFGTIGGNTSCIEVQTDKSAFFVIDGGTGLREFGKWAVKEHPEIRDYHLFFTHFHWDHIQGIPFFAPAFNKKNHIRFYSPHPNFEEIIRNQMKSPYFPVEFDILPAKKSFVILPNTALQFDDIKISWKRMKHPGGVFAYKFSFNGKSMIFATDSEITEAEFKQDKENISFFKDCDMLILDSQYTFRESIDKTDWGHSSYSLDVDLAASWKVKKLVLFHHEPLYDDRKILSMQRLSKWYLNHQEYKDTEIIIAMEGAEHRV